MNRSIAINKAETGQGIFWKMLKNSRKVPNNSTNAIRNEDDKVVYETDDILRAWKNHFEGIYTPKDYYSFDEVHFNEVNTMVKYYDSLDDINDFCTSPIEQDEVRKAISKLHNKKAAGFENISADHIKY